MATKKASDSVTGRYPSVCNKVVRPGRAYAAWMFSTVSRFCNIHFITRFNGAFYSDLLWWNTFLQCWNGLNIWHHPTLPPTLDFQRQILGVPPPMLMFLVAHFNIQI